MRVDILRKYTVHIKGKFVPDGRRNCYLITEVSLINISRDLTKEPSKIHDGAVIIPKIQLPQEEADCLVVKSSLHRKRLECYLSLYDGDDTDNFSFDVIVYRDIHSASWIRESIMNYLSTLGFINFTKISWGIHEYDVLELFEAAFKSFDYTRMIGE